MNLPSISPETMSRYLSDSLTSSEREAFEKLCTQHPQIVQDMETTLRMREGLRHLRERGELAPLLRPAPRWRLGLTAGIAAAIVSLALAIALWPSSTRSPGSVFADAPALSGAGQTYTLVTTRGTSNSLVISAASSGKLLAFRLLPEQHPPDGRYRVELLRLLPARPPVVVDSIERLTADPDGFVTAYAGVQSLAPGRYELAVILASDPAHATRFPIVVSSSEPVRASP